VTPEFAIRLARPADVPAVNRLVNSAFRGESSRAGWTTEADMLGGQRIDEERLAGLVASDDRVVLLHEDREGLLACVSLERAGSTCHLGMLTTRPVAQGRGTGRRMIEAAERWAVEQWQSSVMRMTVLVQRPELVAYYERRGYRMNGERKPFPYDDERFGLPRRDDLAFVVLEKSLSAVGT
jgi:predicted N-acetyltransferase YhbS